MTDSELLTLQHGDKVRISPGITVRMLPVTTHMVKSFAGREGMVYYSPSKTEGGKRIIRVTVDGETWWYPAEALEFADRFTPASADELGSFIGF